MAVELVWVFEVGVCVRGCFGVVVCVIITVSKRLPDNFMQDHLIACYQLR